MKVRRGTGAWGKGGERYHNRSRAGGSGQKLMVSWKLSIDIMHLSYRLGKIISLSVSKFLEYVIMYVMSVCVYVCMYVCLCMRAYVTKLRYV